MELVSAALFIGAVIAGITQGIKLLVPERVEGVVTVAVAVAVGILVAIVDVLVGVQDISIAQGIMIAFGTVGVVTTASKIG